VYVTEYGEDDRINSSDLGQGTAIVGPSIWFHTTDAASGNRRTIQLYRALDSYGNQQIKAVLTSENGYQSSLGTFYMYDPITGTIVNGMLKTYDEWWGWLTTTGVYYPGVTGYDLIDDFRPNLTYCEIREGFTWNQAYRAEAVQRAFPLLSTTENNLN
jgi:hypothetical protein